MSSSQVFLEVSVVPVLDIFHRKLKNVMWKLLIALMASGCALGHSTGADKPATVTGGGSAPVSASVTAMWGAVDEPVLSGEKPLTFMIFFRGKEGWYHRTWRFSHKYNADPFLMVYASELTTLKAEVNRTVRTLSTFGKVFNLTTANVVLVDHVDRPGKEVTVGVAHVDLTVPEEARPAHWILEQYESIRSQVISDGR